MNETAMDEDGNVYIVSRVGGDILLTDEDGNCYIVTDDPEVMRAADGDVWIGGSREWDNDGCLGDID